MGVDIAFYIEVRNQENWVRLHFKPPFETEEDLNQSYWDTDCYFCRYYHFSHFIDEAASHIRGGPKDRICKEIAEHLEDDDSYGTFLFDDLVQYCDELDKKLLASLSNAGLYPMKRQLDRIESCLKALLPTMEKLEVTEEEEFGNELYYSASDIYEEHIDAYYCVRRLRDIVSGIVAACHPYIHESEVRIFYLIC